MQNLYYQLYLSYLEARKNKRNTNNQLAFEIDVETKLYALAEQIQNRTYKGIIGEIQQCDKF